MNYDSAAIRQIFLERFNDQELNTFCFDYFPDVGNDFGDEMSKKRKVQLLLDHCRKHRRWDALLAALQRERPEIDTTQFSPKLSTEDTSQPYMPTQRNPRQIFISHAHQDAKFAQRLAADLKKHGWKVWVAPNSIQPGEKWQEAIDRGLEESGVFVLTLTPDATRSRFVRDETYVAIQLVHEDKLQLLPLFLKDCELPLSWRIYQQIPFKGDYKYGLQALLTKLQPEIMSQLARQYKQLHKAMTVGDWRRVSSLGKEIQSRYPDYREVSQLVAQSNQAQQEQSAREKKLTFLHRRLQDAVKGGEWDVALTLGEQIQAINHDYRDSVRLLARARKGKLEYDQRKEAAQLHHEQPLSKQNKQKEGALASNDKKTFGGPFSKQYEPQRAKGVKSETPSTHSSPQRGGMRRPLWATFTLGTIVVLLIVWGVYGLLSSQNIGLDFSGGRETVENGIEPMATETAVPAPSSTTQPPTPLQLTTATISSTNIPPTNTPLPSPTTTPLIGCVDSQGFLFVWEEDQVFTNTCDQFAREDFVLQLGDEVLILENVPLSVIGPDAACLSGDHIKIQSVRTPEIIGWVIQDYIQILQPGESCQP